MIKICDVVDGLTLMVTFPLVILRMLKPTVGIMSSLNWPDCGTRERFTQDVMSLKSDSSVRTRSQAAGADVIYSPKRLDLCADDLPECVCVSNTWKCWLDRCQMLIGWETGSADQHFFWLTAVKSIWLLWGLIWYSINWFKQCIWYKASDPIHCVWWCVSAKWIDMQYDTLCPIVPYLILWCWIRHIVSDLMHKMYPIIQYLIKTFSLML